MFKFIFTKKNMQKYIFFNKKARKNHFLSLIETAKPPHGAIRIFKTVFDVTFFVVMVYDCGL